MKANEWFACLGYRTVDILIPQDNIFESLYSASDALAAGEEFVDVFHLDDFVAQVFGGHFEGEEITSIVVKGETPLTIKTQLVPRVVRIDFDTFTVSKGLLGKRLFSVGILASRFEENRIQYLVDINQIHSKWRGR